MVLKRNNKGISYIEFILVIAIIFLLTGLATVTMSIVNRNNITKGADRVVTGINHAKTLTLSKGLNKGCITFAKNGNAYYYFYGENVGDKYTICSSPCECYVVIKNIKYNIDENRWVRLYLNQSTGAFEYALRTENAGSTYVMKADGTNDFTGANRIEINNKNGKSAHIDLNVHVGSSKLTIVNN